MDEFGEVYTEIEFSRKIGAKDWVTPDGLKFRGKISKFLVDFKSISILEENFQNQWNYYQIFDLQRIYMIRVPTGKIHIFAEQILLCILRGPYIWFKMWMLV